MSDSAPVQAVRQFDPQSNSFGAIAPSGTFEVGELIRLIGGNFESGLLPTSTWQTSLINGGTATVVTGELVLNTNTTANGEARVQSQDRAEFVTATFNKGHLAFGFDNFSAANCVREFGMFDPVSNIMSGDGVFFRNNSGAIQIVRRLGGADVQVVDEVDFNGNPVNIATPTVKFVKDDNIHIYEIQYNAGRIDFFQDRRLVHRMVSLASVAYETVHLPLGAVCRNINGNTTANILRTRGFSCSRIGAFSSLSDSVTVNAPGSVTLKNSPGEFQSLIITNVGVGTAAIDLYDATAVAGTPFASVSLTDTLVNLEFRRRLNFGLTYDATGTGFEVLLKWR